MGEKCLFWGFLVVLQGLIKLHLLVPVFPELVERTALDLFPFLKPIIFQKLFCGVFWWLVGWFVVVFVSWLFVWWWWFCFLIEILRLQTGRNLSNCESIQAHIQELSCCSFRSLSFLAQREKAKLETYPVTSLVACQGVSGPSQTDFMIPPYLSEWRFSG